MPKPRLRLDKAIERLDRFEAALGYAREQYAHTPADVRDAYLEPFIDDMRALRREIDEELEQLNPPNDPAGRVAKEGE